MPGIAKPCRSSIKGTILVGLGTVFGFFILAYCLNRTKTGVGTSSENFQYYPFRDWSTSVPDQQPEKWNEQELQSRIVEKREKILANDSRLLQYIRENVLIPPISREVPFKLSEPHKTHFSQYGDQNAFLGVFFGNSVGGFFIEAGAHDGESTSNTLWLERERNWTGLLVEPNSGSFAILKGKQRKAWLANSCLSPVPYPQKMYLEGQGTLGKMIPEKQGNNVGKHLICYPLESLLRAIGQLKVDFFSLDVEGLDVHVLASLPWDVLDIKVLMVETDKGTRNEILKFMGEQKYQHAKAITVDDIFVKP